MPEKYKEFEPEKLSKNFNYYIAGPYRYGGKFNKYLSEFNIQYYDSMNSMKDLIAFCRAYPDRNINVSFKEKFDEEIALTVASIFNNFSVVLDISDIQHVPKLRENNVRFFFNSSFAADSYSQLDALISLGASEVYIVNDLCYNIESVANLCHDKDIKLRCVLNEIPSTVIGAGYDPKTIIYCPQDIDYLAGYFDTFEFSLGDDPIDWHKFKVLFNTYFINKKWHGDLSEIINGLEIPFNDDRILPEFTPYRFTCTRRCDTRASSKCKSCQRYIVELQKVLIDKNFYFTDKKK